MKALGLIETKGMVGAIVAADIALKTAQVELINREHTKGGLVCIEIEGDVAAVKASVEAAVMAIKDMGIYVGSHVIPRPDDSVEKIINRKNQNSKEELIEQKIEETKAETKDAEEESLENAELKNIEEEIEEIKNSWDSIGKVPRNKMGINTEFNKTLNEKLKLNEIELQGVELSDAQLADKARKIKSQIGDLKTEIIQLENNIAFFSNPTRENPLLKDTFEKIDITCFSPEDKSSKSILIF